MTHDLRRLPSPLRPSSLGAQRNGGVYSITPVCGVLDSCLFSSLSLSLPMLFGQVDYDGSVLCSLSHLSILFTSISPRHPTQILPLLEAHPAQRVPPIPHCLVFHLVFLLFLSSPMCSSSSAVSYCTLSSWSLAHALSNGSSSPCPRPYALEWSCSQ